MDDEPGIAIWWTTDDEARGIRAHHLWPEYLQTQWASRMGRCGRGRLWVAPGFGAVEVSPWPTTSVSGRCLASAGIVIYERDAERVCKAGIVTDFALRPC